jgi:enoyl-CoA hydratase/carnithine racemase
LINRVVAPEDLERETRTLAAKIAAASTYVVSLGKAAFYRQLDLPQAEAYAYARDVMSSNALAADAQEGMSSFLEKRTPRWTNR